MLTTHASHPERIAKVVIEAVLPGTEMRFLAAQSNGEHDYDLRLGNGTIVPVEVTQCTDSSIEAALSALGQRRCVPAKLCALNWTVHPTKYAKIKLIRSKVDEYLAAVEQAGFRKFFAWIDLADSTEVRRIREDLSIEAGFGRDSENGVGSIIIASPTGEMVRVESFPRVLEAARQAVDRKSGKNFAQSTAAERHLLIYVSPLNYPVWVALLESPIPVDTEPPSNGSAITDVWVATQDRTAGQHIVWRWKVARGWLEPTIVQVG